MTISAFKDDYRFLSNFWVEKERNGLTVEHFYQAAKAMDPSDATNILTQETPGQAKRVGQTVKMREDWEQIKVRTMYENLAAKFYLDLDLGDRLLATGDEELIEGNTWGDRFWGAEWDEDEQVWVGENNLGKLLMQVREELKQARASMKGYEDADA